MSNVIYGISYPSRVVRAATMSRNRKQLSFARITEILDEIKLLSCIGNFLSTDISTDSTSSLVFTSHVIQWKTKQDGEDSYAVETLTRWSSLASVRCGKVSGPILNV